jgi:hypothetical protein
MVLETLAFSSLNHLTRLVAREDFIKYKHVEKFGYVCVWNLTFDIIRRTQIEGVGGQGSEDNTWEWVGRSAAGEAGEGFIVMSSVICILHPILLLRLCQGGWDERFIWHARGDEYVENLVRKSWRKRPLEWPRRSWEDNIRMDHKGTVFEGVCLRIWNRLALVESMVNCLTSWVTVVF